MKMHKYRVEANREEVIDSERFGLRCLDAPLNAMTSLSCKTDREHRFIDQTHIFTFEVNDKNKDKFEEQLNKFNQLLKRETNEKQ